MTNLWLRLAGVERLLGLFIEGEGGVGGGGGTGSGGDAGGGSAGTVGAGGGGTESAAGTTAQPVTTPGKSVSEGGGAPISTQETTSTLVDEAGKPVRELGEESSSFLARHRAWRDKHAEPVTEETPEQKAAKAAAATAGAKTPEQLEAERKAAAEATKTPEQKAAEAAEAAKTPEQKAAEAKAAQDAAAADYDDFSPVPTEKLAEMAKDPEFQKLLEKYKATEGDFFATSRLADKAVKFMQEFPTIESAQHAKVRAAAFHKLDDSFTDLKPNDIAGTSKFVNDVMLPLSYLRDDNGQVMKDPQTGLPITDGSAFVFMDNVVGMRTGFIAQQIEKIGGEQGIARAMSDPNIGKLFDAIATAAKKVGGDRGEQLQLAADLLKGCGKAGTPSGGDGELSEENKARLAEADRVKAEAETRQQELDKTEKAAHQQKIATFKDTVLTESSKGIDDLVGGFLDRTSLKDDKFLRPAVLKMIREGLYKNMSSDDLYKSERDEIFQFYGVSKTAHQKWVSLNVREAKARLKNIADPILAEAGARKIGRAQERAETRSEQEKRSQMETKGGTTTSLPRPAAASADPHALIAQARENLQTRGEEVNTASLLAERRRLMAVPA